jgi:tetratricopeptide (TPR) repeat protein
MSFNCRFFCAILVLSFLSLEIPAHAAFPFASADLKSKAAQENKASLPAEQVYIRQLTPAPVGSSFIVAAPVVEGADPKDAALADGCWYWLQAAIAQTPGCEQTPLPIELNDVCQYLRISGSAAPQEDAGKIAKILGAKFFATGRLSIIPSGHRLEYTLFNISGNPIGAPVSVSGSGDQIASQLPALRLKLLALAKIAIAPTTIPPFASESEAAAIGEAFSDKAYVLNDERKSLLVDLSKKNPLASVVLFKECDRDSDLAARFTEHVKNQPYLLGCALASQNYNEPEAGKTVAEMTGAGCKAYALIEGAGLNCTYRKDAVGARKFCERGVEVAPRDSGAWRALGRAIMGESQSIRHARTWDAISEKEGAEIEAYYPKAIGAARRAVELAPENVDALNELATSCTFGGLESEARLSLIRAFYLDPQNRASATWALQMYQPKWDGSVEELIDVVHFLQKNPYVYHKMMVKIYEALDAVKDESNEAADLRTKTLADIRAYIASPDDDVVLMKDVLEHWINPKNKEEAKARYLLAGRCVKLAPNDSQSHFFAGSNLVNFRMYPLNVSACGKRT